MGEGSRISAVLHKGGNKFTVIGEGKLCVYCRRTKGGGMSKPSAAEEENTGSQIDLNLRIGQALGEEQLPHRLEQAEKVSHSRKGVPIRLEPQE